MYDTYKPFSLSLLVHSFSSIMEHYRSARKKAIMLVKQWAETLPNEFDVLIGVPQNGFWIAGILALKFGRPLSTVDNYVQGTRGIPKV